VISVLVVDDSVVVRRLITDALADDPAITVIGTAPNGRVALQKIEQLKPDLVTLDVEMPVLDGIGTLRELRKTHQRLPVIMFSTLTAAGAAATVEALTAGASDYVTKPANVGSVAESIRSVREQLVPRIHALAGRTRGGGGAAGGAAKVPPSFIGRPGTVAPPAGGAGGRPPMPPGARVTAPTRPTVGRPVPPASGLAGDFDSNGIVDAADYITWYKGLGTAYIPSDYNIWRASYGRTISGSGAVLTAAIPEPASALILLAALILSPLIRALCSRTP